MKQFFFLSVVLLLVFLTACNSETHEEEHDHHVTYIATKPAILDTITKREYVCQIRSIQHIELRALEKGYLQNIYVDEGQFVKKGQLMFQIMPLMYQAELKKEQAELQKAMAEAEFAQIDYQNTKALADSNIVSKNELALSKARLDQAKAQLDYAKAKLGLAQVHLDFTEIRAPFDGIMDRFHVRLGSLLSEGDLMTELSDNSKVWVYFNVPEAEYLDYKTTAQKDQILKVNLKMANNKLFEHIGVVETIEADFNNETGNIAFRATFPNPDRLLRHGETGNVVATVYHKDAIIIPQKATFEILEKKYVFIVGDDNVVKQREIQIESEMPDLYVIRKGLTGKEKILLEGIRKVKNNQKIEYTYQEPEKVFAQLKVYVE